MINRRTFLQSIACAAPVIIPKPVRPRKIAIWKHTAMGCSGMRIDKLLRREGRSGPYDYWYPPERPDMHKGNSFADAFAFSICCGDKSEIIEEHHSVRVYLSLEVMCRFGPHSIWGRYIARGYWHHTYNADFLPMITIDPRLEEFSWAIERYNEHKYSYKEYRIWPCNLRINTRYGPTEEAALLLAEALNSRDVPYDSKLNGMALATYPCFEPRGGVDKMKEVLYG